MFLATPLGCKLEVAQFSPALGIHRFSVKPCKWREEVSKQDYSEEIFHLLPVFGKRFHTLGFYPQTQNLEFFNISVYIAVSFQTGSEQKSDK